MNLSTWLYNTIQQQGPLTIAAFMQHVLTHPLYGYYVTQNALGQKGDFITAPEVSQLFGEMIGIWCAEAFLSHLHSPSLCHLIELGPGRGTLMADLLRITRHVPHFHTSLNIHLVEISPLFQQYQREALAPYGISVTWHQDLSTLPQGPSLIIANEFFDALPIHQYFFSQGHWHERMVASGSPEEFYFTSLPCPPLLAAKLQSLFPEIPEGGCIEYPMAGLAIIQCLASLLHPHHGSLLLCDYGYHSPAPHFGETLQALGRHNYQTILEHLGSYDLTAHVWFGAFAEVFAKQQAQAVTFETQSDFLKRMGIMTRYEHLYRTATTTQQTLLKTGLERLLHPEHMGTLFKVLTAQF